MVVVVGEVAAAAVEPREVAAAVEPRAAVVVVDLRAKMEAEAG